MDIEKLIAKRTAELKPSGIRRFFDIANEMEGVISLGVGEPDFKTLMPSARPPSTTSSGATPAIPPTPG